MNPLPTRINTLPLLLGFRYSFSRRRNRFIGVVSLVSLLGMALGVASLITVLSVMNGFADELRGRILSVVPHATVVDPQGPLANWQDWQRRVEQLPEVVAAAPYLEAKVLLAGSSQVQAVRMLGVEVGAEPGVSQVAERIVEGSFDALQSSRWGVVLGDLLARALGVGLGDQVEITVPVLNLTPLGNLPRRKRLTVVGIFAVGAQMDATHALVGLADGQALLRLGDSVHGLRLAYEDLFVAASMSARVASVLPPELQVVPWQQAERSLFSAVAMEKTVIAVLLLCVVAVAAFNIVSTLTMAVTEKRADIAALRTMGARRSTVMATFVCQGMALSTLGIVGGTAAGVAVALNIADISLVLEQLMATKLFDPQVFFISNMPSRLDVRDLFLVVLSALLLSLLATLVPAHRAAKTDPAEVLRYG